MPGPDFLGLGPLKINDALPSYFINGSVGIGTTTPAEKFHVESGPQYFRTSGGIIWNYRAGGSGAYLVMQTDSARWELSSTRTGHTDGAGKFGIRDNTGGQNLPRLMIDVNGNVGLGTVTPLGGLHIQGTAYGAQLGKAALVLENTLASRIYRIYARDTGNFCIADHTGNQDKFVMNPQGEIALGDNPTPVSGVRLYVNGNLTVTGNARATNEVKVWDSGWFDVTALGTYPISHNLGVAPKFVQAFFRASSASPHFMVLAPFIWGEQATEYGAYIRAITATAMQLICRQKIGLDDTGGVWVTSGQARVLAWA